MKQVVISKIGGPEVLKVVEAPVPVPGDNEVLIKITYAGVAAADLLMRRGVYPGAPKLPYAPGYDVIGTIAAVGRSVRDRQVGQRVGTLTETGGYSEFVTASSNNLVTIPDGIDDAKAVAAILNYGTAYQLVHRVANLKPLECALISGAGGGLGSALVQIAKEAGAIPIGTASTSKIELVQGLGGQAIDYRNEDVAARVRDLTGGKGAHVAFDHVGGNHMWTTRKALRHGGRMVATGFASVIRPNGNTRNAILFQSLIYLGLMKLVPGKSITLYRSNLVFKNRPEEFITDVESALSLIAQGKIAPIIDSEFELTDAAKAHERMEQNAARGKIVLKVS